MLTSPGVTIAPRRSSYGSVRIAYADLGDEAVLDPHEPARVLGPLVVHRDDRAVAEDHSSASSGTSSNASTSTRPRSVILSDGITDSARNERCWNGASSVQPSSRAAAASACERSTTSSSGASDEEPGDRQRQLREHLGAVDDDDAAAAVREPPHGRRHRGVVHADDDDVVRVVCDRRGDRAALQPEAAHEAEPHPAGAEMALDDGDLRQVALGVGHRLAGADARLLDERIGDDLAGHDPDHARAAAPSTGCGTSRARTRRSARCGAPSPAPRRAGTPRPGGRP